MVSLAYHVTEDGVVVPAYGVVTGVNLVNGTSVTLYEGDATGKVIAHVEVEGEVTSLPDVDVKGPLYAVLVGAEAEAVIYVR